MSQKVSISFRSLAYEIVVYEYAGQRVEFTVSSELDAVALARALKTVNFIEANMDTEYATEDPTSPGKFNFIF